MRMLLSAAAAFFIAAAILAPGSAISSITLLQISADPFTNGSSMHKTQVEPDTYSNGSTIVGVFQSGRFYDGGSSDIGFATSSDSGAHWTHGFLPGITNVQHPGNPFDRVSDPAVAYDAKHKLWLIGSLPLLGTTGQTPIVSRSPDGLNWSGPVQVGGPSSFGDKDWIACDSWPSSPFYGHCYVEWDDAGNGQVINMVTSTDGGKTWGPVRNTADFASGIGGQPVVQPNGTVVVPMGDAGLGNIIAFSSHTGGNSWTATVLVSGINNRGENGGLRSEALPSAAVDGGGRVYVVWQDCSFRAGCSENDIVMSTSTDGTHWSAISRIPIDATSSTVDHFIPGIDANRASSGVNAHLALTYYFYANGNCGSCNLQVGYIASPNGGSSWHPRVVLTGPFNVNWLPNTTLGLMVGDYQSTSYAGTVAHGVFAVASQNSGSNFNEAMFTRTGGASDFEFGPLYSSAGERPVLRPHSAHPYRRLPLVIQ